MISKKNIAFLVAISFFFGANGQESNSRLLEVNGYLKDLRTFNLVDGLDSIVVDNLLHNRLNFSWYASDNFTAKVELRNRIFYGEVIRAIPSFGAFVDDQPGLVDLSFNLIDQKSFVFNATIDRFFLEYVKDKWEIRAGRQRINWGVNLAWNPNDIFNAYSFFDFDYEERPGSDAIRIKRYTGVASSVELAVSGGQESDDLVVAGLWKWNKWNYDFQLLAGKARNDFVIGAGWAGSIKSAGFKGEVSWFVPIDKNASGAFETVLWSMSVDYSFSNSLYINGSFLVNTGLESNDFSTITTFNFDQLDTKNVLPFPYATFLQLGYPINPLVSAGFSWMTFPGEKSYFLNPTLTASIFNNFDLDLIAQLFYADQNNGYEAVSKALFLRMKYSF